MPTVVFLMNGASRLGLLSLKCLRQAWRGVGSEGETRGGRERNERRGRET